MCAVFGRFRSGPGIALSFWENGEDNAGRNFLSVHWFEHQSLANPARYRVDRPT